LVVHDDRRSDHFPTRTHTHVRVSTGGLFCVQRLVDAKVAMAQSKVVIAS
jgi:hypothetical protein